MLFKLLLILNLYNGYHSLPNIECNDRLDVSVNYIQRIYSDPSPVVVDKYYCNNVVNKYCCLPSMFFEIKKCNFKVINLPECRNYSLCIKFGYQAFNHTIYYRNYIEYEGIDY